MKIRTKLRIFLFSYLLLVLIQGVTFYSASKQIHLLTEKKKVSEKILEELFDVSALAIDFLRYPTERTAQRWQTEYQSLGDLLNTSVSAFREDNKTVTEEEQSILRLIRGTYSEMGEEFSLFLKEDFPEGVRNGLVSQLLIDSKDMINNAHMLYNTSQSQILKTTGRDHLLKTALFTVITLLIFVVFYLHTFSLLAPLRALTKGTIIIGNGNLKHKIKVRSKDELGDLASAFNTMTEKLEELSMSKDQVNEEIIERRQAEEDLRLLKKELEGTVTERTVQLQQKVEKLDKSQKAMLYMVEDLNGITAELKEERRKLETANKELESFSYSVSHDLRAPLRAIDGFSRILEEDYKETLDPEGRRLLQVVRDNTQKMDRLITDLLEFSRTGRIDMNLSEIDMKATAISMYHEVASPEVLDSFQFNVSDLPPAYGDPLLIRRIWSNLISNAIKYSMPKKDRVIVIEGFTEGDKNVYSVRDNGVGFDAEYRNKLFTIFQRLHSNEEFEGTGVGLAIVKRVVHRHGGTVRAEGKEKEGAVFSFSLPRKEDAG